MPEGAWGYIRRFGRTGMGCGIKYDEDEVDESSSSFFFLARGVLKSMVLPLPRWMYGSLSPTYLPRRRYPRPLGRRDDSRETQRRSRFTRLPYLTSPHLTADLLPQAQAHINPLTASVYTLPPSHGRPRQSLPRHPSPVYIHVHHHHHYIPPPAPRAPTSIPVLQYHHVAIPILISAAQSIPVYFLPQPHPPPIQSCHQSLPSSQPLHAVELSRLVYQEHVVIAR